MEAKHNSRRYHISARGWITRPLRQAVKASVVFGFVVLSLAAGAADLNPGKGSPDSMQLFSQIQTISRQAFLPGAHARRQKDFATYLRSLTNLASAVPPLTLASRQKTVFHVVHQAALKPELLSELLSVYGRERQADTGPIRPQISLPPLLNPRHTTEAYRPAWEALLLAPLSDEIEFMQRRFTITKALAQIGNPESIPVIERAFASTCEVGVHNVEGSASLERQFRLLECLNRFATPDALKAMLDLTSQAESFNATNPPKHAGHTLREWMVRFLTDQDHYQTRDKWPQVISAFPKENLPATQRQILDEAARYWQREQK